VSGQKEPLLGSFRVAAISAARAASIGLFLRPFQQLRQLRDVERDAPGFIACKAVHRHASAGLVLEIDVGERLAAGVPNAEALSGRVVDRPWR
jgi:hypothetical protein